jgi:hypothetical protein
VTGWSAEAEAGVRAEAVPAFGLDDALTGATGDGDSLFVALARLTAEPDPAPLEEIVSVRVEGADEIHVRWGDGSTVRLGLSPDAVQVRRSAAGEDG